MADPRGRSWAAVALLSVLHAALAAYQLGEQSLWLDEVMSIEMGTASWPRLVEWYRALPEQHPLYYALLRPWLAVFGTSDLALRSFSLAVGVAGIPAVYGLGRRLVGETEGLTAAALLALSPFWLYYSQEGRMYTLLVVLSALASLLWLRHRDGADRRLYGYWVVATLGVYTHFFFSFVVLGHAVATLLGAADRRRGLVDGLRVGLPVLVAYLPWMVLIFTHMPEGQGWKDLRHIVFGIPYTLVRFAIGYGELVANYRWQERIGELLRATAPLLAVAIAAHAVLFGRGVAVVRGVSAERRLLASAGILVPLFVPLLMAPVMILSGDRYFMVILPLYLVVLAAGAVALLQGAGARRLVGGVVVAAFAASTGRALYSHHFNPEFGKEQWEEVVGDMGLGPGQPRVVVVAPDASGTTLRYHLQGRGGVEIVRWTGGEIRDLPAEDEAWLVVARLVDPAEVLDTLPPEWHATSRRLYPKETGLWLIRLERRAEGPTGGPAVSAPALAAP